MSDDNVYDVVTELPVKPPERCTTQNQAAQRANIQIDRMKSRMVEKQVIPIFTFVLIASNCDKHGQPAAHVDLITTPFESLTDEGRHQVIAAAEAVIAQLTAVEPVPA